MIHAFVLIKAEREAMHSLGGKLADVEGVTEAYSITGEWDFVAMLRTLVPEMPADPSPEQLGAWAELSELVRDADFKARVRRMVEATRKTFWATQASTSPRMGRDAAVGVPGRRKTSTNSPASSAVTISG